MTVQELSQIKAFIKGAYPNVRDDEASDIVWFDLLQTYEYSIIMQAIKNYIKSGNRFPPTLAELIAGYEIIIQSFSNGILELMDRDGYFNDPVGSEPALASWNKDNRRRKSSLWIVTATMPDWFKRDYMAYEQQFKTKYLGKTQVMIR